MSYKFTEEARHLIVSYVDSHDGYPTSGHILENALGIAPGQQNDFMKKVLAGFMREQGWRQTRRMFGARQGRCWQRGHTGSAISRWLTAGATDTKT